jgi:REP element-mobilizing transposase RayT
MCELPVRKPNRLQEYDYGQNGMYFVTICVKDRAELLGTIEPARPPSGVGATVPGRPPSSARAAPYCELSELGGYVDDAIMYYNARNGGIFFDKYVIMPNHIHTIIVIRSRAGDRGRSPLQCIVRNLKSYVTKKIGFSPWQRSFHDHIIRDEQDYNRISEYIKSNPANWEQDQFYEKPKANA